MSRSHSKSDLDTGLPPSRSWSWVTSETSGFSLSFIFCCAVFFKWCFNCILRQLSQFFPSWPPLLIPSLAPTDTHTVVHVPGSSIHDFWLVLSPSSHHYPPSPSPLVTVSLFHVSLPVVLFCSLDSSYRWDHMYLSFTTWLISLSIMLSSSIHAVTKGRSPFFLSA